MKIITDTAELERSIGGIIATSPWMTIDQSRIQAFADATDDHQWIHIDEARAKAESPFGATIAHGFLTLSLIPKLAAMSYRLEGFSSRVNYGLNSARFLHPVVAGGRIRARFSPQSITEKDSGRILVAMTVTIDIENIDTPACIAQSLVLLIP